MSSYITGHVWWLNLVEGNKPKGQKRFTKPLKMGVACVFVVFLGHNTNLNWLVGKLVNMNVSTKKMCDL